jgi:predicted ester cyclase
MRNTLGVLGLSVITLVACAQQQPVAAPLAPPPAAEPIATPAPAPELTAEPPKAPELTAEQKVKFYQDCWALFSAHDLVKFGDCFADNAVAEMVDSGMPTLMGRNAIIEQHDKPFITAFPDVTGENVLTLQNGNAVLGITLVKGTHKAPMMGPKGEIPATNKKIGLQIGNLIELQNGKIVKQWDFVDQRTFLGQLGLMPGPVRKATDQAPAEKPVVLATGSEAEKANLESHKKVIDAFNKHDAAALEALLADDVVVSKSYEVADQAGKKEALKAWKESWKGMSDAKIQHTSIWSAGDYVVATGVFTGTNDGPLPSAKVWTKTGKPVNLQVLEVAKFEGGKLKKHWLFSNGLAFAAQLGVLPPEKKPKAAPAPKPVAEKKPAAPAAAPAAAKPATPAGTAAAAKPAPGAPGAAAPATPAPKAASPASPAAPKAAAPAAPVAPPPAAPVAPAKPAPAAPAPAAPPAAK